MYNMLTEYVAGLTIKEGCRERLYFDCMFRIVALHLSYK